MEELRAKADKRLIAVGFPKLHAEREIPKGKSPWYDTGAAVYKLIWAKPGAIVCLVGPRGTGKTLMATTIARQFHRCNEWHNAKYAHVMDFFFAIRETFNRGSDVDERETLDGFIKPHILVLDEIQERGGTEWEDRTLAYLIDKRYTSGKATLLLANLKPADLTARLGASIVSRMQETGGIVECNWPSFRGGAK